ncbi:hypothetical protein HF086_002352 [Spodoptera exigua]|uniref:Uncharacterized protein n=1 Tax=Spodoptera exigua TaxID=7107 RepID=A0A922SEW9_SPOEX|nr:hypothetical protein HF086_002352 [Spodoptera exigua]
MKFLTVFALLVAAAAADYSGWSLHDLSQAIQNPNTDPALLPALEDALNQMMDQIFAEKPVVPVDASAPVDLTGWTIHDLVAAMENPETDPALMPFLEQALDQLMDAIYAGIPVESIAVVAPAGLAPAKPEIINPVPAPMPVVEPAEPVETPVVPASSPLVQIIVNVNQQ